MDWEKYKELSHEAEYFTRWALSTTAGYCSTEVQSRLEACLDTTPLEKPSDHKGGSETDVFRIELDVETVNLITISLIKFAVKAKLNQGSSQPNLRPLILSWMEYADWLKDKK